MADSLQGVITDLSGSVTTTNTTTVVAQQTGATVITTSELDTTLPPATSTKITVTPSTDNRIPVLYGSSYVPGMIIDARISNDSQTMFYIYALAEITGSGSVSVDQVWMGEQQLNFTGGQHEVVSAVNPDGTTDTNPAGYIDVWVYRERTTPIFGATTGTTESIVPGLTTNNKYGGLYVAVVKVKFNATLGYTSMPQMTFKMTNTLSNPGAVWYDFMTNTRYGAGIPSGRVDQDTSINDSNPMSLFSVSDETVTYRDTEGADVTGPRYTINGLIAGGNIKENVRKINLASGSWSTWNPKIGKWIVVPNRPYAAGQELFEFSDSNIISGINVSTTSLDSNYNAMAITYPETAIKAQNHTVRVSLFDDSPELLNVNEPENTLNLTLELVDNKVQATRVGLLELKQAREDIVAIFHANYSALQVDSGDVISITNTPLGWSNKLFRVTRVRELESDQAEIQVEISALEYNPDVYTDESIDQFEPIANTDIPRRASSGQLQALDAVSIPDDLLNPVATIPSFAVRATMPSNRIYDTIEFFISSTTSGGTYSYYSTLKPNGGVFQPNTTHDLLVTGLPQGEYFFKVRAKIGALTTPLSNASSGVTWTPGVILNEQALATAFEWSPPTVVVPTDADGNNPTTGQTVELVLRVGTTKLNLSDAVSDGAQANNTWRVTNISYNSTNLVLSSPTYDTVNDKVVWTVNDLNALQENLVITVRYKNSTGDLSDIGTTRVLATQLRAGANGSNSRALRLVTSSNYFTRLKGETDAATSQYLPAVINLTAQLNNIPSGTVSWSAHDASNTAVTLNVSGATATLSNTNFGNRDYVVVHAEIDSGGVTYFDEQTIVRLREGADGVTGITAFLTNEVAALPAATDGTYEAGDLAGITSQIQIYAGTVNVTEQYTLTIDSETGCDANISTTAGSTYGRVSLASVSADLANVVVKAAKAGSASIYKTFVVVKQRRGATGAGGTNGSTARLLRVTSTSPIISIPKNGSISNTAAHQPGSISFLAEAVNLPGVTITWTGQREGGSVVGLGTGTVLTLTATQIRDLLTTTETVRSARITATTTYASETFTDTTSIQRVREGSDTIAGYLTNESASVPCDADGVTIGSVAGITSNLKILLGAVDVTASATNFTVVSSVGITSPTISITGLIAFTAITADSASITVSADHSGVTVVKVFTIVRQRQGLTGSARAVKLSSTNQFFVLAPGSDPNSGGGLTPASITLTATRVNIPNTQAVTYFAVIDGVEVQQTGTPNTVNNQFLFFTAGSLTPSITRTNFGGRDSLVIRAKSSYLGVTYTDDYTIGRLQSGSSGITGSIDNEVVTVGAATNNSIIAGQFPIQANMSVYIGATDDTANWVYTASFESGNSGIDFGISGNTLTVASVPSLGSGALVRRDVIAINANKAGFPTITKYFAIQVVRSGRDAAAQMVLTNEVHNLPADYNGLISSYSGANTVIYLYEAGLPVTDWNYSITSSTNEVTFAIATTGLPTGAARRVTITNWTGTGTQAVISIQASKTGYTSITKTFSLNRVRSGTPGTTFKISASSQIVRVNASGAVQSPAIITFNGIKSGGLVGIPTWSVTVGTATLSAGSGNSITINTGTIASDLITVRGFIVYDGITWFDDVSIVKVYDGAAGGPGTAGTRGSRIFNQSVVATTFNYTTAYSAAQISGGPMPGDTVTQYNPAGTFTQTRIWTGAIAGANNSANWELANTIIDGNLLVTGSVRADKIFTNDTFTMSVQSNNFVTGSTGWSINKNGVAEFSNITARGTLEAAAIMTGSTLKDRVRGGVTEYPIYTTAVRRMGGVTQTLNTLPLPVNSGGTSNFGLPETKFETKDRDYITGCWSYQTSGCEHFIAGYGDTLDYRAGSFYTPIFSAGGADVQAGYEDKINNRLRKFLSTTDEVAFGADITLTTNAPVVELFYMAQAAYTNQPISPSAASTNFYNRIRSLGYYYNPAWFANSAKDSPTGSDATNYSGARGNPPPYRVTSLTVVNIGGVNYTRVVTDYNQSQNPLPVTVGDTVVLHGVNGGTNSSRVNYAGVLNSSGTAWSPTVPGMASGRVGQLSDPHVGVRVVQVDDYRTFYIDVDFTTQLANQGGYGSGMLVFPTAGEKWTTPDAGANYYLTSYNRPWTIQARGSVVWSDFVNKGATLPTFPGAFPWNLYIGMRAPRSLGYWMQDYSGVFFAQNF